MSKLKTSSTKTNGTPLQAESNLPKTKMTQTFENKFKKKLNDDTDTDLRNEALK